MRTLQGRLKASELDMINEKTSLRFRDKSKYITAESLIIHEQGILPDDVLLKLCIEEYGIELYTPQTTYIPKAILSEFEHTGSVPISLNLNGNIMTVGILPENKDVDIICQNYNITKVMIPIYYYVQLYIKYYGRPDFLFDLPVKDKLDFITEEAIGIGAAEITISNIATGATIYYNRKKRKVHSKRAIEKADVVAIAKLIATNSKASFVDTCRDPRYLSMNVDMHNRGRVVINTTYYGYEVTIRILPNELLTTSLEDLNISKNTCKFIREHVLSREKGLRLFIGETMSGKNTTILSSLLELVSLDRYKIVSVEQPVEILVDGIEQIDAETDEEFEKNADSLLRQNPDIVYFTEITGRTANSVVRQSNTSKAVFSSIHANGISDVIPRLMDITDLSADRLLMSLQSCVYQELVRDEEKDEIYPVNKCLYFSDELKMRLYGKTIAEIKVILQEEENKWQEVD